MREWRVTEGKTSSKDKLGKGAERHHPGHITRETGNRVDPGDFRELEKSKLLPSEVGEVTHVCESLYF